MLSYDILLCFASISVLYWLSRVIPIWLRRNKFSKEHNCEAVTNLPQFEQVLGFHHVSRIITALTRKEYVESMYKRFTNGSKTYSVTIMGTKWIQTVEPMNVKHILATKFEDFDLGQKRSKAFLPLMGKGIFTSDGEEWTHFRALLRPSFKRGQIANLDMLEAHTSDLISSIPTDGSPVDLKPLFFRFTLNTTIEFLFGRQMALLVFNSHSDGEYEAFGKAFEYGQAKLYRRIFLGSFITLFDHKFQKANETVHTFVDGLVLQVLDEQRKSSSGPLAKPLVQDQEPTILAKELAKDCQDPIQLRNHLIHILQAGRDTSASLISNTIFELARNPSVWKKLREEVSELARKKPTYEELKSMKYLRNVIQECKSSQSFYHSTIPN
jgi:cytochrome P450